MAGTLYLCATPIGNLEDMTFRAVRILKEVDVIAAEDTRNSVKLLNHFDIHTPMTSYHEFNKIDKGQYLVKRLLEGENILLCGGKATGKNILPENLASIFGRPTYNITFNVNTDSSSLIGTDTFVDNEVRLRKGPVYQCAENGGFGVFDEINMAKNDAVSVLHATLDYRRIIDVPG